MPFDYLLIINVFYLVGGGMCTNMDAGEFSRGARLSGVGRGRHALRWPCGFAYYALILLYLFILPGSGQDGAWIPWHEDCMEWRADCALFWNNRFFGMV
jgi:hypothetical protein